MKLKEYLQNRQMTNYDFALMLKVSHSIVSGWIKELHRPTFKNAQKIFKKTKGQVLLNWAVGRGPIAIPKSVTPERISENIDIFDFEITVDEKNDINSLNRNYRFVNPSGWWKIPYFA